MAPLCSAMSKKNNNGKPTEKADFSSIINFLGGDIRKDKKRRRGDAEKKRRDRINTCLDQLEELIPYVRQKKLCSKVDKAEVLELTVHFVKETLFEKELSFRKSHIAEYERMKWLGSDHVTPSEYERKMVSARKTSETCSCGCSDGLDKRAHQHVSLSSSYPSYIPPSPRLTSPLHRKDV